MLILRDNMASFGSFPLRDAQVFLVHHPQTGRPTPPFGEVLTTFDLGAKDLVAVAFLRRAGMEPLLGRPDVNVETPRPSLVEKSVADRVAWRPPADFVSIGGGSVELERLEAG
jgi:hypothetical protein